MAHPNCCGAGEFSYITETKNDEREESINRSGEGRQKKTAEADERLVGRSDYELLSKQAQELMR